MRELSIPAQAAKQVRQWLKAQGIPARVVSESYSMGSRLNVYVQDLNPERYKKVDEFVDQYQYGDFDGYNDIYNYRRDRPNLPQVKYAFVKNEMSDEMRQNIWDFIRGFYNGMDDAPVDAKQAYNYRPACFERDGALMIYRFFMGGFNQNFYWDAQVAEVM